MKIVKSNQVHHALKYYFVLHCAGIGLEICLEMDFKLSGYNYRLDTIDRTRFIRELILLVNIDNAFIK